jgi:hypothetical protein
MSLSEKSSIRLDLNEEEWCRFLGEIGHKMKNQIGGIHGFCSLLEKDLTEDDPNQRLAVKAQEGILQLNSLLTLFMKIFHSVEPQPGNIDLAALFKDTLHRFGCREPGAKAPVLIGPERPLQARLDPEWLKDWTWQALAFGSGISQKIESLRLEELDGGRFRIGLEFALARDGHSVNRAERIGELLLNAEPFELRLSLAIVARYSRLLGGKLEYSAPAQARRLLTLQLNQG